MRLVYHSSHSTRNPCRWRSPPRELEVTSCPDPGDVNLEEVNLHLEERPGKGPEERPVDGSQEGRQGAEKGG